jgi:DNA-binding transcriptional LysR family regulator
MRKSTKTVAHRFLETEAKPLRLGIMPSVGPLHLAPFLTRFGIEHPEIEFAFVEGEAARLEELLLGGSLDVAVAARLEPTNRRLRHYRLYRENVVVVFPRNHRFERQDRVRLVDLKGESFLLRANCEKRLLLLASCRSHGFEPKIVYHSEREDWIQMMVAAGRGVTLLPESLHAGQGTLARPLVEPALNREVSLISVAGRPHTTHVRRLMSAIREHKWDHDISAANGCEYCLPSIAQSTDIARTGP